ncbi:MAG TPA: class I SAM-dependent methyltransferase, partial [Fimbriimonas sp.]
MSLPEYAERNRSVWTKLSEWFAIAGRRCWAASEISWGIWSIPESQLGALGPLEAYAGKDVIELGCGTGYFSGWFAKLGAKPVGIDVTPAQLDQARAFQKEFGFEFPLIEGNAEEVPLPSQSFDVAFSEYGASIWCDPYRWIPEAARLLRPGGRLIFLRNTTLSILCMPPKGSVTETLQRPLRGL